MMLLGVVIHAAVNYAIGPDTIWPYQTADAHYFYYILVDFIHTFRMPTFFIMSGFFAALLFYKKGAKEMIRNRFQRIFLPFIVFLLLLTPLTNFTFEYCKENFANGQTVNAVTYFSNIWKYIPFQLGHLWFLHYLFILSLCVMILHRYLKFTVTPIMHFLSKSIIKTNVNSFLFLSLTSWIILIPGNAASFETSINWLPKMGILLYYLNFYLVGWVMYLNRANLEHFANRSGLILFVCLVLYIFKINFPLQLPLIVKQLTNSIITAGFSTGIVGVFIKKGNFSNSISKYGVNTAYWVYIIHFIPTLLIPVFLKDMGVSVHIKFLISLTLAALFCFITFELFVRNSFIGTFLNGKKNASNKVGPE
jgi:fucose 4-O-acetylase-like acetyltransferase